MHELLSSSLDALTGVRDELQGSVDDSVIRKLEGVISDLEAALKQRSKRQISVVEVLAIFGQVLDSLPEIIDMIERLRK